MRNREFTNLKNSLAIRAVVKIILYSIGTIIVFSILIDNGFLGNEIANRLSDFNRSLYLWCVRNKILVLGLIYLMIFGFISFLVIRNTNNNMIKIISAMDEILKEPKNQVKLPPELAILESRLNNIRVDLITNQAEAKESLEKKNDLIMYMAHDLKTPLTSIIGYLTLLSEEQKIPKDLQKKYIDIALNKALRVEDLTNQFFDITRYNLNSMPISKQNLDIAFLLDQLTQEFYPMLQEKNLECTLNKTKGVNFFGDGDKLARAFGNLLKNAISYSYENSKIEINIEEEDGKIKITFKNKGDKIPEYKLNKLFEKFYRGDESRTSNTGGAGLGLAITKEIIELHDGKISVKNDDEYIEFCVVL